MSPACISTAGFFFVHSIKKDGFLGGFRQELAKYCLAR